MTRIGITDWHSASEDERLAILERPAQRDSASVTSGVRDIIRDVRERGDVAIRELTEKLDGVQLSDFDVTTGEFDAALKHLLAAAAAACCTCSFFITPVVNSA